MGVAPLARPTGATVVAVIEGILGILAILAGVLAMGLMGAAGGIIGSSADPDAAGVGALFAGLGFVLGVIVIAIGVLYILIAYGVWKGRGWSWMLGVIVSIIALVFGVLGLTSGINASSIISVALPAIVLYFLWTPDVKRWLGRPA
jgi:hypothetical protein